MHRRFAGMAALLLTVWACGTVYADPPSGEPSIAAFDLQQMGAFRFEQGLPALNRPLEPLPEAPKAPAPSQPPPFFETPFDAPLGYSGPSGILPREGQTDPHFVPVED